MKKLLLSLVFTVAAILPARAVYTGASAGYLVDSQEAYYAARIGTALNATEGFGHNLELEFGYTETTENYATAKLAPILFNYRAESSGPGKWVPYFGVGAGMAKVKVSFGSYSDDDASFAAQAFVGYSYKMSEAASLRFGARYLYVGDTKLLNANVEVGDDVSLEAGFSLRF
ncbi:MAG: hypothetical protein RIS54_24 [Verrucomicrobiota bacterium]|jgi:opacity protein-like surface antigen